MHSFNKFFFFRFCAPVSWVQRHSLINPPKQEVKIVDLKNENAIKQINKAVEISRAAAEKRECGAVIGDHRFDFVDIPKPVLLSPFDIIDCSFVVKLTQRFA